MNQEASYQQYLEKRLSDLERRVAELKEKLAKATPHPGDTPYWPDNPYPHPYQPTAKQGCQVCGIGADGQPLGYVCTNPQCPSGITYCATDRGHWSAPKQA